MSIGMFDIVDSKTVYRVGKVNGDIKGNVDVPGSKSITNRALLLAAMSGTDVVLKGVLFSDDSRYFLGSLVSLGFNIEMDEQKKEVRIKGTSGIIPNKTGTINVGSAGTAARFLTAFLALSDGEYVINCSEQMMKRPMKELFDVLTGIGAEFTYLEREGFLPVRVKGNGGKCKDISIDIDTSTQFLSAILLMTPIVKESFKIFITSKKKDGSYVKITRKMLKKFGIRIEFDGENYYIPGNQSIRIREYLVEPDLSAACYFYAMAALTGGCVLVRNVFFSSMQGDKKFFGALERIGCKIEETAYGIRVHGPVNGEYCGIEIDMNDFSDQTMTMAVLAAYAKTKTVIKNVNHIRHQECDRINAIVTELNKVGVECKEYDGNIEIIPRKVHAASIETYDDHRMAMAFTLLGLRTEGIVIENPMCCKKTFEGFYDVLRELVNVSRE